MTGVEQFTETIVQAGRDKQPLQIVGGGSKSHLGTIRDGLQTLCVASHAGIIDYHPAELVVRVKAGTRVRDLVNHLQAEKQMLAFEPPVHSEDSTIGGIISAGLSGSARPYRGAVRDHLLGVGMVLHDGAYCEFGGQVMKNVAGYDVSRLVCGAYGTLGLITDVSLKVIPAPEASVSLVRDCPMAEARDILKRLAKTTSPVSAACFMDNRLTVRLSGSQLAVDATQSAFGGEPVDSLFWTQLDVQSLPGFRAAADIWRLSTEADEPVYDSEFAACDWGFAQRWLLDPETDPRVGYQGSGHWTRIRHDGSSFAAATFHPLASPLMLIHQRLKSTFDPDGLFNPGRMDPGESD